MPPLLQPRLPPHLRLRPPRRLRLHRPPPTALVGLSNGSRRGDWSGEAFDETITAREKDADEFYTALAPAGTDP